MSEPFADGRAVRRRRARPGSSISGLASFTVKHFHEHLVKDHGFGWGYTWLRLHLQ
jgi:hypothetical protein